MKDIYTEPFLSYWPTPLSFKEIKECFQSKNPIGNNLKAKRKDYLIKNREDANIVKDFWNVLFVSLNFKA